MFKNHERPLHGMMYSLGEITEILTNIAHELKRANDLQSDIYLETKRDRHKDDLH